MSAVSAASAPEVNYGMCPECLASELHRLATKDTASVAQVRPSHEDPVARMIAV